MGDLSGGAEDALDGASLVLESGRGLAGGTAPTAASLLCDAGRGVEEGLEGVSLCLEAGLDEGGLDESGLDEALLC